MRITTVFVVLFLTLSPATAEDDFKYSVLLIGNSHSSRGNLPSILQQLLESHSGTAAKVKTAGRWAFLAERLEDKVTQKTLESETWTHVVLQAQKYSTSGQYTYPTDAAEEWIRRSRNVGAQPILFPEWARRDHVEEGARVHRLHMGIAAREPACVAPIGLAWEIMLDANPDIALHDRDGNHANRTGALLTAYVLYAAITGQSIAELAPTKIRGVSADKQILLRTAAEQAVSLVPPCRQSAARYVSYSHSRIHPDGKAIRYREMTPPRNE
jgi:hypothetical protein